MLGGWNRWKDRSGKSLGGPKEKENWKPSVSTVKTVNKFVMATKKLTHISESDTEDSVAEQRREMEGRVAGSTQTYFLLIKARGSATA